MDKPLNIFDFSNYRTFIKRWLEKAKDQRLTNLSRLAEKAQVHSTFLSHVLSGKKDLNQEQAALISQAMSLNLLEQDYFFALIQLDRAGNQPLKQYWQAKKKEIEDKKNKLSERFQPHQEISIEQKAIFYSSWIYVAVWVATAIESGQTYQAILERFKMSPAKTQEVLDFLVQTGLCREEKGVYSITDLHLHVGNDSPLVVKHHTNWRVKAIQKMDTRENSELFFSAPMSIAKKDFEAVRERLNLAIKDIVEIAKDSKAEEVACLNMDLFWVLK